MMPFTEMDKKSLLERIRHLSLSFQKESGCISTRMTVVQAAALHIPHLHSLKAAKHLLSAVQNRKILHVLDMYLPAGIQKQKAGIYLTLTLTF